VNKLFSCTMVTIIALTVSLAVCAAEESSDSTTANQAQKSQKFKAGKDAVKKFKRCGTQCNCAKKGDKSAHKEDSTVTPPGAATVPGDK